MSFLEEETGTGRIQQVSIVGQVKLKTRGADIYLQSFDPGNLCILPSTGNFSDLLQHLLRDFQTDTFSFCRFSRKGLELCHYFPHENLKI
jgi:hypothetical protein